MEFLTRFVRGGKPQKKPVDPNSPQVRLAALKRAYNNLLIIWHNGDVNTTDAYVAENARIVLHRVSELLGADQRGPTPHLCVSFAATSRLLVTVARLSSVLDHDGVTHEALNICSLLIDSEEEAFLEDRAFADALPEFTESIQRCGRHELDGKNMEGALLELLFGLAAKLRVDPHVLRVWFRPEKPEEDDEELSDDERRTRFEEFPLFYLLLSYATSEGRAGEFARMGMLYVVECTAQSPDLEKWIVQGDMAALMASGLGALYSQLSRKLSLAYTQHDLPAILKFSERAKEEPPSDVEVTTSSEYQGHVTTFLSSLVFWQDLLEHCASSDVKQTLLDHYQYLFLQQLLYPSLLESSDIDGGSAVAVLTYLRHILGSIDHPDLTRLTFSYLFGQEIAVEEVAKTVTPVTRIRRRKSDLLFARLKADEDSFSPDLFNLTDLIMTSLKSHNQQVVTATCQLLSTLLRRPHHNDQPSLLRTRVARRSAEQRTVGAQEKEVDKLLTLAENVTAFQDLESSYEHHVHDNRNILESHPCSAQFLNLPAVSKTPSASAFSPSEIGITRSLSMHDPILRGLVTLLARFFKNDIETNLSLTQAIIDLASCGYLKLEGWLVTHPSKYAYADDEDESGADGEDTMANSMMANSIMTNSMMASSMMTASVQLDESFETQVYKIQLARRQPRWAEEAASPVHAALEKLLQEAEAFQREIADFDTSLFDCRNIIEGRELGSALSSVHGHSPVRSEGSDRKSPSRPVKPLDSQTPARASKQPPMDSIGARLKSDRAYGGDSGYGLPRGRQLDETSTPTLVGRLSHLQVSPTRSSSLSSTRTSQSPQKSLDRKHSPSPQKLLEPSSPRFGHFRKISAALGRRVKIAAPAPEPEPEDPDILVEADEEDAGSESGKSGDAGDEAETPGEEVPLGQLLTNVIVLQEFILELAALIEVRGTLFREVKQM